MVILGISGSLRRDSYNTKLLRAPRDFLELRGMEFVVFDGLKAIPPYDEDDNRDPAPAGVSRFREALARADGVLFATPEYNSSIPGQLKNALDWISRPLSTCPLRNKPVAVVGASTGAFGAVWSQAELRKVLAALGARVVEHGVAVGHAPSRFHAGKLTDDDLREQLAEVIVALVVSAAARTGATVPIAA